MFGRKKKQDHYCPRHHIFVLAENYSHYLAWLKMSGLSRKQATYVTEPRQLQGIRPESATIVIYETFWRRKDVGDLYSFIVSRGFY